MRVLVADGDEAARDQLAATVRGAGHEALVAGDAAAAWAAVLAVGVDVVVAAEDLPGSGGLKLCVRIRGLDEGGYTYVVLLTADDGAEHALRAVRAGVDDHLAKPVDPLVLEARLVVAERITDLHRQLRERRVALNRLNDALLEAARTDALTGLYNRRRLDEDTPVLDEGLARYGRPFAVALLDVDHFKAYNDRYGHGAGDRVLRAVAGCLSTTVRQGDLAYRYGGEEFLLVYPAQGIAAALVATERARLAVAALGLRHEGNPGGTVTISAGVAGAVEGGSLARALEDADVALYGAKAAGRNRVQAFTSEPDQAVSLR